MSLCTLYFNLQLHSPLLITYGRLLKHLMKPLQQQQDNNNFSGGVGYSSIHDNHESENNMSQINDKPSL